MGITAGLAGLPVDSMIAATPSIKRFKPIKFGIMADIHYELTPDVDERLDAFLKKVDTEKPDFVICLGDFIHNPNIPQNEAFAKRYKTAICPAYHVMGNHDVDHLSKEESMSFLEMPAPYYSFDIGGYHCVVLDGNNIYSNGKFIDYEKGNYFKFGADDVGYISDEQCNWLATDLKATKLPVFIFSHQSLLHDLYGIPNRAYIQRILEKENERAGFNKIVACFNGHNHRDYYRCINNIHYFSINSVSYSWHDQKLPGRYSPELQKKYSRLDNITIYKDPLFCFVTISASGHLSLIGKTSQYAVPTLEDIPSECVRFGRQQSAGITDHMIDLR
jgi:predicted phosphodiesterase